MLSPESAFRHHVSLVPLVTDYSVSAQLWDIVSFTPARTDSSPELCDYFTVLYVCVSMCTVHSGLWQKHIPSQGCLIFSSWASTAIVSNNVRIRFGKIQFEIWLKNKTETDQFYGKPGGTRAHSCCSLLSNYERSQWPFLVTYVNLQDSAHCTNLWSLSERL